MLNNLKNETIVFSISIIASIFIILITNNHWEKLFFQKEDALTSLNSSKELYYAALNKEKLLSIFENKYLALKNNEIIGSESRLDWVDTLDKISKQYKIPYLKYTINKQEKSTSEYLTQYYPGIKLYKSSMSLKMQLLHEGDLYTVLNNLRKKSRGLFDIERCAIIRNETQVESLLNSLTDKNFSASCILNWYTIQPEIISPNDDLLSQESN